MNVFTSARPQWGVCNKYCRRTSGAHSSSTTLGFQDLPQNSVNQRSTIALLSQAFDLVVSNASVLTDRPETRLATAHAAANRILRAKVRRAAGCVTPLTDRKSAFPFVES